MGPPTRCLSARRWHLRLQAKWPWLTECNSDEPPASRAMPRIPQMPQRKPCWLHLRKLYRKRKHQKPQTITNQDGSVNFYAPILLAAPVCLQCHGSAVKDIAPATMAAIKKLYPDDKATGFQLGDLRGLWRVTFPATTIPTTPNDK